MTSTSTDSFHQQAREYYEACFLNRDEIDTDLATNDPVDTDGGFSVPSLESVLSVDLLYHAPNGPCRFSILLTTGGPAARVVVDVDENGCVQSAEFEYQDWFRPWYAPDNQDHALLLEWSEMFYLSCPYRALDASGQSNYYRSSG